jgi:hypothetical protein
VSPQDLKLGILNAITLGLSFTRVEDSLKLLLLLLSIVYTIMKIDEIRRKKKNDEKL